MSPAPHLLLVDDDPLGTELTLAALELLRPALRVEVAADGEEALACLAQAVTAHGGPPPAMLLDLKMPKVDGHEVLRQVRADERLRNLVVVVLTSSARESDRERCDALGCDAYLVKPAGVQALVDALRSVEARLFSGPDAAGQTA